MNKTSISLNLALSLLLPVNALSQTKAPEQKMPVSERMANARAAKAEKRNGVTGAQLNMSRNGASLREEKATPVAHNVPIDKMQKVPNGEAVRTGERGGKFYINKNGNKTYSSSNQ